MIIGYKALFTNRQFPKLWIGQVMSALGDSFRYIALLSFIYDMRESTADVGMALMIAGSAAILAAPLAGIATDKYPRKRIMVFSAVMRGIMVIMLALSRTLSEVYVALFLFSLAQQFFNPALNAFIPNILDKRLLISANGMLALTFKGVAIIGPAVGGLMIDWWGYGTTFHMSAIAYFALAFCILRINQLGKDVEIKPQQNQSIFKQYGQSIEYIRQNFILVFIVSQSIVTSLAGGAIDTLTIAFAKEILGVGTRGFAMILSAKSAGFLTSLVVLEVLKERFSRGTLLPAALILIGTNIVVFSLNSLYAIALLLSIVDGMGNTIANILSRVVLQDSVPDQLRGKVFATNYMLFSTAHLISTGLGGVLAGYVGLRPIFFVCGLFVSSLGLYGRMKLNRLLN